MSYQKKSGWYQTAHRNYVTEDTEEEKLWAVCIMWRIRGTCGGADGMKRLLESWIELSLMAAPSHTRLPFLLHFLPHPLKLLSLGLSCWASSIFYLHTYFSWSYYSHVLMYIPSSDDILFYVTNAYPDLQTHPIAYRAPTLGRLIGIAVLWVLKLPRLCCLLLLQTSSH